MESFIFALNAVLPIILMVVIGYLLKRIGLITVDLAKSVNKLVFKLFLPSLVFINIYKIESFASIDFSYIIYSFVAVVAVFLIGIPLTMGVTKDNNKRGPVLQCLFRSNYALIGIPLAISLYGNEGGAAASLLSAVAIPLFNVLAVISLTVFTNKNKGNARKILLGIIKNPLILGVLAGCFSLLIRHIFVNIDCHFRLTDIKFAYKVLEYLSSCATPIALIMLGAQFEFSAIPGMKREIIFASLSRVLIVPFLGISIALLFPSFKPYHFVAFIALFATPVAVSSVPMAQESGADSALAGQLVVWTTVASAFTLFGFICALRAFGILV